MGRTTHTVPIHLETEEPIVLNLTGRQCVLMGTGITLGSLLLSNTPSLLLGGCEALCMLTLMSVLAFTRIAGRSLEEWAVIWLLFTVQPKCFLWRMVPHEHEPETGSPRAPKRKEPMVC